MPWIALVSLAGCGDDIAGESNSGSGGDSDSSTSVADPTEGPGVPEVFVELEWAWEADEVTVLPLVADIRGDATPEVVINTARDDGPTRELGEIVALDGATGAELWRIVDDPAGDRHGSHGLATPAIGHLSGTARPDIANPARRPRAPARTQSHAADGDGAPLWTGHALNGVPVQIRWDHGAAAMVNLDADPEAEIASGGVLRARGGLVVGNRDRDGGALGTPPDNSAPPLPLYSGGLPTFADLTGDGRPELLTGREAWVIEWSAGDPPAVTMTLLWRNLDDEPNTGSPAADALDHDGSPEVVPVAWPDIKVLDGKTGLLWCGRDPTGAACEADPKLRTQPVAVEGFNLGGPATIADFDGDGRPEAGIAGGTAYALYDFNRAGEEVVLAAGEAEPEPGAMFVRWTTATQDASSSSTGSSVFDFQSDGAAEVSYQDECNIYILDGRTGFPQLVLPNSSGTVHEYPLVVDVDGGGPGEVLTGANLPQGPNNAPRPAGNFVGAAHPRAPNRHRAPKPRPGPRGHPGLRAARRRARLRPRRRAVGGDPRGLDAAHLPRDQRRQPRQRPAAGGEQLDAAGPQQLPPERAGRLTAPPARARETDARARARHAAPGQQTAPSMATGSPSVGPMLPSGGWPPSHL